METPQDKIKEFFWELDKQFPANHPFIVLHGSADKFREYLEKNIQDTERIEEIEEDKEGLETDLENLKETVKDVVNALELIDTDKDSREEIAVEIETIIKELKYAL